MQVRINGVDIVHDVDARITECIYEEYASRFSNTLTVTFIDEDKLWSDWLPTSDDTIQIVDETQDTGILYIHKLIFRNGLFSIIARSMPKISHSSRFKEWQDVTFSEIGSEIAANLGMSFENEGVPDSQYESLVQKGESDLSFFEKLCQLESAGLTVYDQKLIAYDEEQLEAQPSQSDIRIGIDGRYRFSRNDSVQYGTCTVKWTEKPLFEEERYLRLITKETHYPLKVEEGTPSDLPGIPDEENRFELPESNPEQWFRGEWYPDEVVYEGTAQVQSDNPSNLYVESLRVTSDAQALRWANGLLRQANKYQQTGSFTQKLNNELSAGMLVNLSFDKSPYLNGKYFIDEVVHDFKNNSTKSVCRKV